MRSLVRSIPLLGILLVALLSAAPSEATVNEYVEDFFTAQYRDTLNTTALWDVVTGELKLPPYVPTLAGSYVTPGGAYHLAISGDYAYVADWGSGLQVIDISDPTTPALAGSYDTPGNALGVAISGDYAYVADAHTGLQVIDIGDPTTPALAGSYYTPDYAKGVAISGDYAYLAVNSLGLLVIDITDPTTPTLAGSYDTGTANGGVAISGDYAYVTDAQTGLQVIDISDPTTPAFAGSYDTPGVTEGVAISGDFAYVGDQISGLHVIDISDPTNPTLAGSYDTPGHAYGVAISGDYAYVADWGSGLQVIDISDPTTPALAGSYDTPGNAVGVAISGDYAYVADGTSGLQVIRIADPMLPPRAAGDSDVQGPMEEPVIAGDYVYAVSSGGLGVFDITDPTSPTLAGSYATPGGLTDIALGGDHLYLADGNSGFRVLDVSDPTNPFSVGTLSLGWAKGVSVQGNYAYVNCDYTSQSFNVVDISDPTSPALAGYLTHSPGLGYPIVVDGNYAYFGTGVDVRAVDITDPTTPTLVGSCATPADAFRIVLAGNYAYVACYSAGLQVMDIADPTTPVLVGSCALPGLVTDVVVEGDCAYVGGYADGLHVVDITDPTNPVLIVTHATTEYVYYEVAVAGDYAYTTGDASGMHVVEIRNGRYDVDGDTGQSLAVDVGDDSILWARLTTTQVDSVTWELSADGGSAWEPFVTDDAWYQFGSAGTDLLWRSTHSYTIPGVNPACSDVRIKWLYDFGVVESIIDFPNDQGRQVRISWAKSGHDYLGSGTPITEYAIYRRIDDDIPLARASVHLESGTQLTDRYPPGDWDFLGAVPACCEDDYAVVVPTVVDSTIAQGMYYTTFFVRALTATPGVYFDAPPDSGYSVDNIAPAVPAGFALNYTIVSGNELSWEASEDEDFQYFRVYRDDNEEFEPSPENLIHMTVAAAWLDPDGTPLHHYKITALDHAGNESDPASPESVTGVDEPEIPERFALHRNVPNPLRSGTVIAYDVPADGGEVRLTVYNVAGRRVRTLVDGLQTAGRKSAAWDGRDDRGNAVGSGVYYCRLEASGYEQSIKITVLR